MVTIYYCGKRDPIDMTIDEFYKQFSGKNQYLRGFYKIIYEPSRATKARTGMVINYKIGIVKDHIMFNPTGKCRAGGIYFANGDNFHKFFNYGTKLVRIQIVPGSKIYVEDNKFKADSIEITKISLISQEATIESIKHVPELLKYLPYLDKTHDTYVEVIKHIPCLLEYVPEIYWDYNFW